MTLKRRIALWFAWRKLLKEARPTLENLLGRPLTRKEMKMKNWKTTVVGIIAGMTGGTAVGWTDATGNVNWWSVALAIITSLFGLFTKDADTTGIGASATKAQ
jgi:hypothetical protein